MPKRYCINIHAHTIKIYSKCVYINNRSGKKFKCLHCGYTSHAEFNISGWEVEWECQRIL